MTWDEFEKATQFLLDNQARNEAQIAQLGRRVDQLTGEVSQIADLIGRLAESTRVFVERANGRFERLESATFDMRKRLDSTMAEMGERINLLIGIVEHHITDDTLHRKRPQ